MSMSIQVLEVAEDVQAKLVAHGVKVRIDDTAAMTPGRKVRCINTDDKKD